MAGKKIVSILVAVLFVFSSISSGVIELAGEGFIPEPNEEITVQIQTDTPLFAMGIGIYVVGDANIISAMNPEDCNNYGWDSGWNCVPYIDPNGWVYISGVRWDADANGIIGYFKFRYNSGQVIVYIDQEYSTDIAFDWDSRSSSYVPFSTDTLVFGESDPNDSNQQGNSFSQNENISATESTNDVNLPLNSFWQNEQEKRQKYLIRGPAGSDSNSGKRETFNKAKWQEQFQLEKDSGGGRMLLDSNEPNVIDVNSDITTNQIWTADNVYHVTADVNVQALLVIEPNTLISFSGSGALFVNNGGTLISVGTPNEPIFYTSDAGNGWYDYYCAIYIEETASPATKIAYNYIDCAYIAIITDSIRLDRPIENNYFFYNSYGVLEYGTQHTDIINNLIYSGFNNYYYSNGIKVFMASSEAVGDANSHILIQNNTCDYHDYGIMVHGVADENDAGSVEIVNNIITQSYECGLNLVDGYMLAVVSNTGYGANTANKNWEFEEYAPMITTENPYVAGAGFLDVCYLDQNCPFIDAGLQYVEETSLIGQTTDINGTPDSNKIDIGFHYPNWNFSNAGGYYAGDLDENLIVDFRDFAILANSWLETYDINSLAEMGSNWLMTGSPAPNLVPSFDKDPNNLSGHVQITVNVTHPKVHRVFLLLDGNKCREFGDFEDGSPIGIDTERFTNGVHSIKIVCMNDDQVVTSASVAVVFNNPLNSVTLPEGFVPSKDFDLYALGTGNYSVEIRDIINDNIVYGSNFQNGINAHISANAFSEPYGIYEITAAETGTLLMSGTGASFTTTIGRKFRKEDFPPNCNSKMVVSIGDEDIETLKEQCWQAALKAGIQKGFNPILLRYQDGTWDNLSYCLNLNNVKIWYHCSHGNYDLLGQPQRQCIGTADGKVFSYLKKDLDPNNIPPNYGELMWFYEDNHSIAELGFFYTKKMIWVQFNACFSARTTEFPYALGIWPIDDPSGIGTRIFIGWENAAFVSDYLAKYNQFEEDYWDMLRQGYMLQTAVMDSLPPGGTYILDNFLYYGVIDWQYAWFRYPNIN